MELKTSSVLLELGYIVPRNHDSLFNFIKSDVVSKLYDIRKCKLRNLKRIKRNRETILKNIEIGWEQACTCRKCHQNLGYPPSKNWLNIYRLCHDCFKVIRYFIEIDLIITKNADIYKKIQEDFFLKIPSKDEPFTLLYRQYPIPEHLRINLTRILSEPEIVKWNKLTKIKWLAQRELLFKQLAKEEFFNELVENVQKQNGNVSVFSKYQNFLAQFQK
jgi:hypothetical protein